MGAKDRDQIQGVPGAEAAAEAAEIRINHGFPILSAGDAAWLVERVGNMLRNVALGHSDGEEMGIPIRRGRLNVSIKIAADKGTVMIAISPHLLASEQGELFVGGE